VAIPSWDLAKYITIGNWSMVSPKF
jgi:hypothetical protein